MTNSHAQAIEKQCSIVAALAAQVATNAQRQAGIAAKMEAQFDVNIGAVAAKPFNDIVTAAKEIENRLAGLDMHFRAIRNTGGG